VEGRNDSGIGPSRWSRVSRMLHDMVPSLAALGLALILAVPDRSLGFAQGTQEQSRVPELCGAWHRGAGETHEIDLEKLSRDYRSLRDKVRQSVGREVESKIAFLREGFDSGLPACRGDETRRLTASKVIPGELRGRQLWFFDARTSGGMRLPREVEEDPRALLFVLGARKLEDLGEIAKSLHWELSFSPRGFAETLGVRCAGTRVLVTTDGEIEIHEVR
jgi:hypothetical protein